MPTKIEWTDESWNPVTGCTKVSPGCKHCYAERFAERFRGVISADGKRHPFYRGFDPELRPDRLTHPRQWRAPRMVFVNSMSDLFGDSPHRKAHRMAKASEVALGAWAKDHGWYLVSFTKASGYPRNGIIDAVLIRIAPKAPDVLHVGLVQLKSGGAGLTADERIRLNAAKGKVRTYPMTALYDGKTISVEASHLNVDDAFKVA